MEAIATGSWLTWRCVRTVAVVSAATGLATLLFLWLARHGTVDFFGVPVGSDFTAFWHAGLLANAGEPAQAWNLEALNAEVQRTHGVVYPTTWIYPPVFLIVMAPLGALPYLPALLVWQALSLTMIGLTLRAILRDRRALFVALASPLTIVVLAHGQNAFLTAALLGSGLVLLERRPGLAGGFFGGLLYKPQLGLMIAPLLLLTKSWRATIFATMTATAAVGLSLIFWGEDSWRAFFENLNIGSVSIMEQGSVGFYKSASLFAIARQWDAPINVAYAAQGLGVIVAMCSLWVARISPPYLRAAVVCAGAALSTPYLFDYDMAVVGVGAAFLYAGAKRSAFLPYERSALAFIWTAPWFRRPAAEILALPLSQISMILLLWLALRRVRSGHRHAAVDVKGLPGDVSRLAAREVDARGADILAPPHLT